MKGKLNMLAAVSEILTTILVTIQAYASKFFLQVALAKPTTGDAATKGLADLKTYLTAALAGAGAIFIVIGVVSIATTIKSGEQNPEAITGAVKNIIIGALFIIVDTVVGWFGA